MRLKKRGRESGGGKQEKARALIVPLVAEGKEKQKRSKERKDLRPSRRQRG